MKSIDSISDPMDYYYRPLFDLNKEMIVNDFGEEMQLECAYPPSDAWVSSQYQSKNFCRCNDRYAELLYRCMGRAGFK